MIICNHFFGEGGTYDADELYMDVTLLVDVSPEDAVMKEEIFGPIMPVITVNSPQVRKYQMLANNLCSPQKIKSNPWGLQIQTFT